MNKRITREEYESANIKYFDITTNHLFAKYLIQKLEDEHIARLNRIANGVIVPKQK